MANVGNMEDNVVKLEYQGKEIILIPTAHVSKQSAELVRKVINEEKPESIVLNLTKDDTKICRTRKHGKTRILFRSSNQKR